MVRDKAFIVIKNETVITTSVYVVSVEVKSDSPGQWRDLAISATEINPPFASETERRVDFKVMSK